MLKAHEARGHRRRQAPNANPQRPPKFSIIQTRPRRASQRENAKRLYPDE